MAYYQVEDVVFVTEQLLALRERIAKHTEDTAAG
jgi:hypothetical protein